MYTLNAIEPACKDHLCIRTTFCWSLWWSLYTSVAVYIASGLFSWYSFQAAGLCVTSRLPSCPSASPPLGLVVTSGTGGGAWTATRRPYTTHINTTKFHTKGKKQTTPQSLGNIHGLSPGQTTTTLRTAHGTRTGISVQTTDQRPVYRHIYLLNIIIPKTTVLLESFEQHIRGDAERTFCKCARRRFTTLNKSVWD